MKKILTILGVTAVATLSYGQGTIAIYSISSTYSMYYNDALSSFAGGTSTGGTSTKTATTANGFYYTLLTSSGAAPTDTPLDAGWSQATSGGAGIIANPYLVAGGIKGPGGSTGVAVDGWASGTSEYFMLVGWSSSLGTTWSQVESEVQSGNWASLGYFGVSSVGNIQAGSPSPGTPTSIFGGLNGLPNGVTMYAVPEPATLALAGLSGLSLLAFRRRKA